MENDIHKPRRGCTSVCTPVLDNCIVQSIYTEILISKFICISQAIAKTIFDLYLYYLQFGSFINQVHNKIFVDYYSFITFFPLRMYIFPF